MVRRTPRKRRTCRDVELFLMLLGVKSGVDVSSGLGDGQVLASVRSVWEDDGRRGTARGGRGRAGNTSGWLLESMTSKP